MANITEHIKTQNTTINVCAQSDTSPISALPSDEAEAQQSAYSGEKKESCPWRLRIIARTRALYSKTTGSPSGRESGREHRRSWCRTVVRFGPLSGIFALILVLLSIVASLGVLAGSDHTPVASWPTPPATFIAIFTAVGNLAMRYAAVQGIVIAWWGKALQGTSVDRLHCDWRSGTSFRGALSAGHRSTYLGETSDKESTNTLPLRAPVGWTGLACIFSTLVAVDGPLLQRASVVLEAPYTASVALNRSLVPQLPGGYTGWWAENDPDLRQTFVFNESIPGVDGPVSNRVILSFPYQVFNDEISAWQEDKGYVGVIRGCQDTCTSTLIAPALAATKCETLSMPVDYNKPYGLDSEPSLDKAPPLDAFAFAVTAQLIVTGQQEEVAIYSGYSTNENCVGTYYSTMCNLKAAIAEYNVTVQRNTTFLDAPESPRILQIVDNPVLENQSSNGGHKSTLAGLIAQSYYEWQSFVANMKINGTINAYSEGTNAWIQDVKKTAQTGAKCPDYGNQTSAMLASMNKLMVFYALAATRGVRWKGTDPLTQTYYGFETHSTTTGYMEGKQSVFHTQYSFFAAAAVFEILCVCLVLPAYRGFWKIGRPVSFSPLEIAKAFEAPLLADSNSNSTGRDMADAHANLPVQWSIEEKNEKSRLALFTSKDRRSRPENGSFFDE